MAVALRRLTGLWGWLAFVFVAGMTGAPAPASAASVKVADATAAVNGANILLANSAIVHRWHIGSGGTLTTTQLGDPSTGRNYSTAASPEFQLLLNSANTSSSFGWKLISASAKPIPPDPARPSAGPGVEIVFKFGTSLLELDRTWTLYPHSSVQAVESTLTNRTPATFRIGRYSLAELTAPSAGVSNPASATAFHGGADWRQDFRVTRTERGRFDDEGQIGQFGATALNRGWFLASERRTGAIDRVGRDAGDRTWIGVDNARDVLDAGPLLSNPPAYNRIENPAYPAPIRQRTLTANETLELGRAYLGVYHGGTQQAAGRFVEELSSHEMPAFTRSVDLNTFHPWEHGPGLSDANLRAQARIFKALGGEVFMLDDQWQGKSAGDWLWDAARFPNATADGVPDFVHYLHSLGVGLGLWMSPAEFNPTSATYKQHPDWACKPTGNATATVPDDSGLGVWDMNNPALRAHLTATIDRLIAQDGVREFKFDYVVWVDCPPHDYLDYEDAYAAWVRQQEARHPNVTFELDETNDQRLWALRSITLGPSWFDNAHLKNSTYPARLLHDVFDAAPWLAPSTLGFGTYDAIKMPPYSPNYLMPIALLGHVTFWSDLTKLSHKQRAQTRWWLHWYRRHRSALSGLVYEDTAADPIDGKSWAAFQPWRGNRGYLFVFRQAARTRTSRVHLTNLVAATDYRVVNVRTGHVLGVFSARQLANGLAVRLPRRYSAAVLSISPARCATSPARRLARRCPGQRRASAGAARRRERSG